MASIVSGYDDCLIVYDITVERFGILNCHQVLSERAILPLSTGGVLRATNDEALIIAVLPSHVVSVPSYKKAGCLWPPGQLPHAGGHFAAH